MVLLMNIILYGDVILKSFPYLVVYEVEDDAVIIYAVHCTYKHPDKKFRK